MMRVLAFCAVAMLAMPAVGLVEQFKATIDGSFNIYHSSGGNEGYGDAGGSGSARLMKSHQHLGYMDWAGAVGEASAEPLASFVNTNGVQTVNLYIHAAAALGGKGAIVTLRTSNVGDLVEDQGLSSASYNSDLGSYGVAGSSGAVAFRMADYELTSPGRYANDFSGIDKFGFGTFAGEPWKTPSTRNTTVRSGMWGTPGPNAAIQRKPGAVNLGYDGDNLWGVEGVVGFDWAQNNSTATRFKQAGQLVNQDIDGNFLWLDPVNQVFSSDASGIWYKVPINPALVKDIANNWENKGLVFSNWVLGGLGGTSYNNNFDTSESAYAPYLEIITPEPMTLTLLAMGGLALIRRRR